jgi:putative glutamine amidotransferase
VRVAVTFANRPKDGPYEQALREVGIEPVPIWPDSSIDWTSPEGLVLTGGTDINPVRYGQPPEPETQAPDEKRDDFEMMLLRRALFTVAIPVLAICRGMQLFNVFHGGTLTQHLPPNGPHQLKQKDAVAHAVRVAEGTRLASILGTGEHEVNSRHHQAVDRAGDGLVVSAVAPDGVIEAVERPNGCFAVAVQWHPEDRILLSAGDRRLFEAFAEALTEQAAHPSASQPIRPNRGFQNSDLLQR